MYRDGTELEFVELTIERLAVCLVDVPFIADLCLQFAGFASPLTANWLIAKMQQCDYQSISREQSTVLKPLTTEHD